jgi:hypothetical protein
MRMRLHAAESEFSPGSSLEMLRRIQHHRINLNGTRIVRGLSRIDDLQARMLRVLGVPTPDTEDLGQQLSLTGLMEPPMIGVNGATSGTAPRRPPPPSTLLASNATICAGVGI